MNWISSKLRGAVFAGGHTGSLNCLQLPANNIPCMIEVTQNSSMIAVNYIIIAWLLND